MASNGSKIPLFKLQDEATDNDFYSSESLVAPVLLRAEEAEGADLGRSLFSTPVCTFVANASNMVSQEQIDQIAAGLNQSLSGIQPAFVTQVLGNKLPLLGDQLANAAPVMQGLRYVDALRASVVCGLSSLKGAATNSETQVEQALVSGLAAAGISAGAGPQVDLTNPNDIKLTMSTSKSYLN